MEFDLNRVVLMGLGQFGGGVGVARFLVRQGADLLITDVKPAEELSESLAKLEGLTGRGRVSYRLGEHRQSDFTHCDLLVVNPAINHHENLYCRAARSAGVPLTSEICLTVQHLPDRNHTIGVTGTAGKSTVTAMIGMILSRHLGEDCVHVGGNIGGSLLEELDDIKPDHWVVLELSSFMLDALRDKMWSPHIAVLTNISPNHLDWHADYENYLAAKQSIFDFQSDSDYAVLPQWQKNMFNLHPSRWPDRIICFDNTPDDYLKAELHVPGSHNRMNAVMACGAVHFVGIKHADAEQSLVDFPGLAHRLEFVGERNDVRYFNDSKSTTPQAAILALDSFDHGSVHVILGGYDKGSDLAELARFAVLGCRGIYTIGATGNAIADSAEQAKGQAPVVRCGTLDRAVVESNHRARSGDVVLLSPGCASWDQFDSFEQRGQRFVEAIRAATGYSKPARADPDAAVGGSSSAASARVRSNAPRFATPARGAWPHARP